MASRKVTLSLPDELLATIDRFIAEHPGVTRSGICANALREWTAAQQEAEIERYYLSQSDEERADDEAWRSLATESARRLWP